MNKEKTIKIVAGGSFLKIYNVPKHIRDDIWNKFKFKDKKKAANPNTPAFVDVYFRALDRRSNIMGIGFLNHLCAYFEHKGWDYELNDLREFAGMEWNDHDINNIDWGSILTFPPRDYQKDVIVSCLENGCGVINNPTGGGKCLSGDTKVKVKISDKLYKSYLKLKEPIKNTCLH